MVKKTTKAIFLDGNYEGEYDWKGGIPLSEGEIITVEVNGESLSYKLVEKVVVFHDEGEDQLVSIVYKFQIDHGRATLVRAIPN